MISARMSMNLNWAVRLALREWQSHNPQQRGPAIKDGLVYSVLSSVKSPDICSSVEEVLTGEFGEGWMLCEGMRQGGKWWGEQAGRLRIWGEKRNSSWEMAKACRFMGKSKHASRMAPNVRHQKLGFFFILLFFLQKFSFVFYIRQSPTQFSSLKTTFSSLSSIQKVRLVFDNNKMFWRMVQSKETWASWSCIIKICVNRCINFIVFSNFWNSKIFE